MMAKDSTLDSDVGAEMKGDDSRAVFLAAKLRQVSDQFGWPMLLLYFVSPSRNFLTSGPNSHAPRLSGPEWILSIVLIVASLALRISGRGYRRGLGPVFDGPYRYLRNPIQCGAVVIFVVFGWIMGLTWWSVLAGVAIAVVYLTFVGTAYDRVLIQEIGPVFLRYSKRVKRWWPTTLPGANRSNRGYSFTHALWQEKDSFIWFVGYLVTYTLKHRLF